MKNQQTIKLAKIKLRQRRTRRRIVSLVRLPRLTVFRSAKHFYIQIIDDQKGVTLCAVCDRNLEKVKTKKPLEIANEVGKAIAKKAQEKKISQVVFDRGAYQYHGRVKAAADGAREGGLKF